MESLIIAGVSLLILFPIVYFLPLGFTAAGKVLIVVTAFLIALFGLVAVKVFPLWETGLILLLFVSFLTYLLNKGKNWLYQPKEEIEPVFDEEVAEKQTKPKSPSMDNFKNDYTYIANSDKVLKTKGAKEDLPSSVTKRIAESQNADIKVPALENSEETQKPTPTTLLEKLVFQNEKDLSLIKKAHHFDEENEPEIKVLNQVDQKNDSELNEIELANFKESNLEEQAIVEVEDSELQELALVKLADPELNELEPPEKKEPETISATSTNEIKFNLEELLDGELPNIEEEKPSSVGKKESHNYMSEIEKMLEVEKLEINEMTPQELPANDSLTKSSKVENDQGKNETIDLDNEIEEISIDDLIKEVEEKIAEETQKESNQEYDLEVLELPKQASLQIDETKKQQEDIVDNDSLIKQ